MKEVMQRKKKTNTFSTSTNQNSQFIGNNQECKTKQLEGYSQIKVVQLDVRC